MIKINYEFLLEDSQELHNEYVYEGRNMRNSTIGALLKRRKTISYLYGWKQNLIILFRLKLIEHILL